MELDVRKNVRSQASKIIRDIVTAYETGVFDDPKSAAHYCGLLACICEGKVQGSLDEATGQIKWSLTPEYSAQVDALRDALTQAGLDSGNIVKGPWL